jgi:competence protein ComEA
MIKQFFLVVLLAASPLFTSLHSYAADVSSGVVAVVNINSADASTLAQTLKGVGKSRAEEIVRYREAYGPFYSMEDLLEVRGVGKSILNNNRKRITLE